MAYQVLEEYNSLPIQHKPQTGCHKLLNKYLLMVTFENDKNYSIRFDSIRNLKKNTIRTALVVAGVLAN